MTGSPWVPARPSAAGPDDAALLAAHVAGDRDAFGALVYRHRDRLWGVALRTLGNPDDAADALQDALISAFRGAAGYRGDAAVTTWLHRIVVNACLDRVRRAAARPAVPLGEHDLPSHRDAAAEVDARLAVRAALAQLPPEQREALVLVDLEDLPVAEVARLLGIPTGTVKSRCSRGRTALVEILGGGQAANRAAPGNPEDVRHVASSAGSPGGRRERRRAQENPGDDTVKGR